MCSQLAGDMMQKKMRCNLKCIFTWCVVYFIFFSAPHHMLAPPVSCQDLSGWTFLLLTFSGLFPVCPLIWRLALQNSSIKQDTGFDKTTLSWWWWWHCLSLPFNKCLLSSAQPGTYLSSSISRYYLLSVCHRRAPSLLLYVCFSV